MGIDLICFLNLEVQYSLLYEYCSFIAIVDNHRVTQDHVAFPYVFQRY